MVVHIDERTVLEYQMARLEEQGAPKSINEEVGFLLRILSDRGELLRGTLKRRNN